MAYDRELADRVRRVLAVEPVDERRTFGGVAFFLGGHMAVCASSQGGLMVRVAAGEAERLLAEPGAGPVTMGGRGPMTGWLRVAGPVLDDEAALRRWVQVGVARASSLPPKG